ncbi:MAG: AIR synthase-related protein [bacterium]
MDLKAADDRLYVVGETRGETGGSAWARLRGAAGPRAGPQPPRPALFPSAYRAIAAGWVRACHDASEGGLAVALAEMALAGGLALRRCLDAALGIRGLAAGVALFAESSSRLSWRSPRATRRPSSRLRGPPCRAHRPGHRRAHHARPGRRPTLAWPVAAALAQAFGGH